ncbi:MAG: anion permease, partial [Candidatus Bathyarchaeia archaeon]
VYGLVLSYLTKQGFQRGSRYGVATLLALGQASTAGALIFLTSTPPNLIAKKTILSTTGINITFVDWFIVGSIHAVFGLLSTWVIVYRIIKPDIKE